MADDSAGAGAEASGGYVSEAPVFKTGAHSSDLVSGEEVEAASAAALLPETQAVAEADEFQLGTVFYDAYRMYHRIIKESDDTPSQEDVDKLSTQLRAIAWRVDKLHLFSPNEELDDINTADLKFLLVPFLLGEAGSACQDLTKRIQALKSSLVYWRTFAQHCERLHVIDSEDMKALGRAPSESLNANAKRDEKIARYKRSKELDQKVAWLFKKKKACVGDEFSWGHTGFDEDLERDLIMAILGRAGAATAEQVASAEAELPMLEMMMANGGPGKGPPARRLESAEKPWVLKIQDKAELQKLFLDQVFQPDIPMPTMSLAEAADIEMDQIDEKKRNEAKKQWDTAAYESQRWWGAGQYSERENAEEEAKLYKDRNWDEWKEEHPYGSGNKMANIG